jgi:hypothetical protein
MKIYLLNDNTDIERKQHEIMKNEVNIRIGFITYVNKKSISKFIIYSTNIVLTVNQEIYILQQSKFTVLIFFDTILKIFHSYRKEY